MFHKREGNWRKPFENIILLTADSSKIIHRFDQLYLGNAQQMLMNNKTVISSSKFVLGLI